MKILTDELSFANLRVEQEIHDFIRGLSKGKGVSALTVIHKDFIYKSIIIPLVFDIFSNVVRIVVLESLVDDIIAMFHEINHLRMKLTDNY